MAVASASTPSAARCRCDDLLAESTDVERGLVEVVDGGEALVVAGRVEVAVRSGRAPRAWWPRLPADCSTNTRSAAGAQHVQLAVGADVVDPGVGAGVGDEDQALVEAEGQAIGHRRRIVTISAVLEVDERSVSAGRSLEGEP